MAEMDDNAVAHHHKVKQLFNAVCGLTSAGSQRATLQRLGADSEMQDEVLRLLGHLDESTRFAEPVAQAAAQWLGQRLLPGDRLGAWTLLRPLGEGGMGHVFLAERSDGHYQQQVAIKLLLGSSGAQALARLTSERQLLARMNHPHIAKLLDGGSTPAGQPYLVMEYADGDTLDVWCERHKLGLAARLAIFQTVCAAVAHAHRHLVVHCDIKPANVLVNAEGRAMLLDFGISHIQGQGDEAALAMTPAYASPEQMAGQVPGIASDVFSLGRVLAELLRPIADSHTRGEELAAVVARATATEPEQRYGAVGALQADLRRLLAHQPLAALAGSRAYLVRKGLRRHWPWVLAAALVLTPAVAFTARLMADLTHAQAAQAQAQAQAREALARALAAERAAMQRSGTPSAPASAPVPPAPNRP